MKLTLMDLIPENRDALNRLLSCFDNENVLQSSNYEINVETMETPKILYHYTSLSTLIAILSQVKKTDEGQFILRGTPIEYLNDWSEFNHGTQILTNKIIEYEGQNPKIEKISNRIHSNNWKGYICLGDIATSPFITSFSKNKDSLPMWNMYGDNGQGVAFGVESSILNNLINIKLNKPSLKRCRYSFTEFEDSLKTFENIGQILYQIFQKNDIINYQELDYKSIRDAICSQKHESFDFEKEWRLIKQCSQQDPEKEIYVNENTCVPYIENKIPITALKEIVIGPCKDLDLTKNTIEVALQSAGIAKKNVEIFKSEAPFRNI